MHIETEISLRAIKNIESKLNLKTISLGNLDQNTLNKLILALIDWVCKNRNIQFEDFLLKAIIIAKEALKYANDLILNNLKSKNILGIISNILNSQISQNITNMCQELIQTFLRREAHPNITYDINNSNYLDFMNQNISNDLKEKFEENQLTNVSNNDLSNKNFIYKNKYSNFNNFSQDKEQNFTFNNQINSYYNNTNINNNSFPINLNASNSNKIYNTYDYSALKTNTNEDFNNKNIKNNEVLNYDNAFKTKDSNFNKNRLNSSENNSLKIPNKNISVNLNKKKKDAILGSTVKNCNKAFNNNSLKNDSDNILKNKNNENKNFYNNNNQSNLNITLNLNGTSTFPLLNISKQEEQILYDANINLKFGDSLHISKTLNHFYFNILNEFPIEYLLQNSEIIKSILIIMEKSNHLEYGNILYRILDRLFNLIEKKLDLFCFNLSNKSIPLNNSQNRSNNNITTNLIFYPSFPEENQNNNKNPSLNTIRINTVLNSNNNFDLENCISVRDFLIMSAEALILSAYSFEKLPFSVILLEKNFSFLKKLMIENNDDEWTIIILQLFKKLQEVILFYKAKNINFHILAIVLFRFILSLSDSAFVKFNINSNYEIIAMMKEIIFIFDETQSNLVEKLFAKIKRIIQKYTNNKILLENLNNLLKEYERADILKASIEIAKRINSKLHFGSSKEKSCMKYTSEEYKFIVDNFNNILLAYKYFIETNEPYFMSQIIQILKIKEEENDDNNGYLGNEGIQVSSHINVRYPSSGNINNTNYYLKHKTNNFNENENESKNLNDISEHINNNDVKGKINNNEYSFIKFLSLCFLYTNSNENYLNNNKNINNHYENNCEISNNKISECFIKLISFLNSLNSDIPYKNLLYVELLEELKLNENLNSIFYQTSEICLGIINDLSQSIECKNKKLENCIIEIIYEINNKSIMKDRDYLSDSTLKNSSVLNSYYLFDILPVYPKSMKFLSLNAKIEKNYTNLNSKFLKYLRLLFSTNELIRLNSINYFKNIFNLNTNFNFLEDKIIEYVEFTNNYEKLKKLDLIYSIQTAEKEYESLYKNIIADYQSIQIEFFPLLNIIYSNKMDYNMKTAAIEQLIFLTFEKKFSTNFCNEIIFFCFDILLSKFDEYKTFFEKKIILNNTSQKDHLQKLNFSNNDYTENSANNQAFNFNNLNSFVDEFYKDSNLNYISSLMKLINLIILNNSENESIKNFLNFKKNEKLLNLLHGIIILLFPSDFIENCLNADFKKPRSKHIFNVNLVYFLNLVCFNLKNSYNKNISSNVIVDPKNFFYKFNNEENGNQYTRNKQKYLLDSYSFLDIQKLFYFNIIPIKNYVGFSIEGYNDNLRALCDDECQERENNIDETNNINKSLKNKWDNFDIKRNIIEFIKYKSFYNQINSKINDDFIQEEEIVLNSLYDSKLIKKSLLYFLNESSSDPNYMEIFINTSKLFELYLSENFRFLFSNLKQKNPKNQNNQIEINRNVIDYDNNNLDNYIENPNYINSSNLNLNSEISNFENKESHELVQILSFLKCLIPQSVEERNIIIDIVNSIKIFLSFYKNFLNFKSPDQDANSITKNRKHNNLNDGIKIDKLNYEKKLKDLESSNDEIFLPLIKKGLNDCLYNYLSFICNSKTFLTDFQKNNENQLFFVEILDLVVSNEELFDADFYTVNSKTIMNIIKSFINLFYNSDLLHISRLLVTKLAVNLFEFANSENLDSDLSNNLNYKNKKNINSTNNNFINQSTNFNDKTKSNNKNLNSIICENKNFIMVLLDSIDFFVSNYKHAKLKSLSNWRFNKKNNFVEYNEDVYGNIQSYYPYDPHAIEFKDLCLLKNNLLLLTKILDLSNNNLNNSFRALGIELQNKIAGKSFTLLKYIEFSTVKEEQEINDKICDNVIFGDVLILILNIMQKIKSVEGKFDIIKTNPIILNSLYDFAVNNSAQNVLVIAIVNFLNMLIDELLRNSSISKGEFSSTSTNKKIIANFNYNNNEYDNKNINYNKDTNHFVNENYSNINNYNNIDASQNLENINPINEYATSGISNQNRLNDNAKNHKMNFNSSCNQLQNPDENINHENFIEEIIILNEKIYEVNSFMNLINLFKKNVKNSLLNASYLNLLKKLILLSKLRSELNNTYLDNINYNSNSEEAIHPETNLYDLIANSAFFETQNEIFKSQIENFEFIINYSKEDFLNNFFPESAESTKHMKNKQQCNSMNVCYSVSYYNSIYYDKINSKINKLHEMTESLILVGGMIDMFCLIFAKCSDFHSLFQKNKIIILENLNNLVKFTSLLKSLKNKINKRDFILFFEVNNFTKIFKSLINKFFSLFHLLYYKDDKIINEAFLEISLSINDLKSVKLNNKFSEVNDLNMNYKLQNSILNFARKKMDVDFENESSYNQSNIDQNSSVLSENKNWNQNNIINSSKNYKIENYKNKEESYQENYNLISKANKFIELCYDLLVLEENDNLEVKVYFAKIIPYLIETIIYYNQKLKDSSIFILNKLDIYSNTKINNNLNINNKSTNDHKLYADAFINMDADSHQANLFIKLKHEGDTILQLMTGLKLVYNIKYEKNDLKTKCKFTFENNSLTEKNTLMFAISSLLLVSQTSKKLFIKSNFIMTFIDYIKQLSEKILEINLERKESNKVNKSKITTNIITNITNTNITYTKNNNNNYNANNEKEIFDYENFTQKNSNINLEYIISEYKNVLILFQNLFCDFYDCEEKESLFIPIEIINQNFLSSNISNLNIPNYKNIESTNNSIISKSSVKNSNTINTSKDNFNNSSNINKIQSKYKGSATINTNKKSSKNLTAIKDRKEIVSNMTNANNSLFENNKQQTKTSIYAEGVNSEHSLASNFLKTLYEIFYDTIKYDVIHENYLKLLINIISKNEHAKKSFIISVSNPESIGNKDSFLIILLEYFQKKFLNNNLNNTFFCNEANLPNLDLFVKLLKCLFQNKQIVLFLLKIKFIENFQKDLLALLLNKKYFSNKSNQICLTYLLDLFVSLSFDNEICKKIADKELIEVFTDAIIKIKNENIIYNILFIFRNLSFVNQNKAHFLANEALLGTIFAVLSGDFSLKIKFMVSHLLWILLFNNQTVN